MFTRQQWPPSSFWGWEQVARFRSARWSGSGEWQQSFTDTYEADAPDAGIYRGVLWSLCGALSEEEVEFVIVALGTVRDELSVYE